MPIADAVEGFVLANCLSKAEMDLEATPARPETAAELQELRVKRRTIADKGDAILVNHGSFNPPHRGHLVMVCLARRRLEEAGYRVTSAHLGITGAAHIRRKGAPVLEDSHRVACINLLAEELGEPWIVGDADGVCYNSGGRMASVMRKQRPDVTAFNVKGADLAEKYGAMYGNMPTVWVGREGCFLPEEGKGPTFAVAVDEETGDFSSTRLRQALEIRDSKALRHLCGEAVTAYLLDLPADAWSF